MDTKLDSSIEELVKGLFNEQMKAMVTQAPTDNFIVYAFLVSVIVMTIVVAIIIKFSINNVKKDIGVYIDEIADIKSSITSLMDNTNIMRKEFNELNNQLIKFQSMRTGEEDKIDTLMDKFREDRKNEQITFNNLFQVIKEHDRDMRKIGERYVTLIAQVKAYTGTRISNILVDRQYITREKLKSIIDEIVKDDLNETDN